MLALAAALLLAADPPDRRCPLPSGDPCVYDVRAEFGAAGDGVADDTAALQAALDAACGAGSERSGIVYLPAGTYRLTGTLVANRGRGGSGVGPWLWGESRDGVVLKLDDGVGVGPDGIPGTADDVTGVIRTHPADGGKTSANWFMRNLRRFTVDAGDNPHTDGIRYFASNLGVIRDVTVRGNGPVGIHSNFLSEAGPDLVHDVTVDGFAVGVSSQWRYGQTLCDVTVLHAAEVGVKVAANAVGIEDLRVEHAGRAVICDHPRDWHWWGGAAAIVGGEFRTHNAPILNTAALYGRDLHRIGGGLVVLSETPGGNANGERVREYFSHPPVVLGGPGNGTHGPVTADRLPVRKEPRIEWEPDPEKWLCANEFGITADGGDDTAAMRAAFDAAAERGCTVVTLRGVARKGRRPWYNLAGEVVVKAPVRQVLGLGFARTLGPGGFVVDESSAPLVRFQNLSPFGGSPLLFENRSPTAAVVVDSAGGRIVGSGGGPLFLSNTPARVELSPGVPCWARHLNVEGDGNPDRTPGGGLVANRGGRLWVMGTKSEGTGTRFATSGGGTTEVYGAYEYTNGREMGGDPRPMFTVAEGSRLLVAGVREVSFNNPPYRLKAAATDAAGEPTAVLDRHTPGGRAWFHFGTPADPSPDGPRHDPGEGAAGSR